MWVKQHSDRLSFMVGVTPGISSDFVATKDAIRISCLGAATYRWKRNTQLMLGVAYLDRADISILPVAGLVWTPNEDSRLEVTLPRPRFAKRIHWNGYWDSDSDDWVYLAGQLGGGTSAIRRSAGFDDEMTLRDFRLLLGVERTIEEGWNGCAEIGYVFGREIKLEQDATKYRPSNTVLLKVGFSYR
jgi:hypothetical protein